MRNDHGDHDVLGPESTRFLGGHIAHALPPAMIGRTAAT